MIKGNKIRKKLSKLFVKQSIRYFKTCYFDWIGFLVEMEEETQSQQKSIIKKEKEIKTTKTLSRTTKTERQHG